MVDEVKCVGEAESQEPVAVETTGMIFDGGQR
jgi:hypothetical protein